MKSVSICALCVLSIARNSAGAEFVALGHLPGGEFVSSARGVSADRSVVVGTACTGGENGCVPYLGQEAFRWTSGGGMASLGESFATDVSADSSVIVGGIIPTNGVGLGAFRWTQSGGMAEIGAGHGFAWGVSADGAVVVGERENEAFRWTSDGGMVGLGDLPGGNVRSTAFDVSADGLVVVGGSDAASGDEAFRWTSDGGMVGLGKLTGHNTSVAHAESADGSVVVGSSAYADSALAYSGEAFRWTSQAGMVGLGDLPGGMSWSVAEDVSADGSVLVGYSESASGTEAFVWDATNGMRNLCDVLTDLGVDMTGWTLRIAHAISADATTIVGEGTNPLGHSEAWLAKLRVVPEPSTFALASFAFLSLLALRLRTGGPSGT